MGLTCKGDLSQLATQKELLDRGFSYYMSNVYPIVTKESIRDFLYFMYTESIEGWWHYKDEYVKHKICIADEFTEKLKSLIF